MVRLTADLIFSSPHFFNAVRERELDLRGNKIPAIENLGATEDHFDSLDMSDNEIVKLEGFPLLRRISTLLLSNNRITRISTSVGAQLPNLRTLVLSNNRLCNLSDLDPLAYIKKLEVLSLLDNVVAKRPKYRLYVINLLPKLRLLDFRKVTQKERKEARAVFRKAEVEKQSAATGKTFVPGEALEGLKRREGEKAGEAAEAVEGQTGERREAEGRGTRENGEGEDTEMASAEEDKERGGEAAPAAGPTPEQLTAIKAAIATAQTLEEVARLEKALKSGKVPEGIGGAGGVPGNSAAEGAAAAAQG